MDRRPVAIVGSDDAAKVFEGIRLVDGSGVDSEAGRACEVVCGCSFFLSFGESAGLAGFGVGVDREVGVWGL